MGGVESPPLMMADMIEEDDEQDVGLIICFNCNTNDVDFIYTE
jgi:hypothetical protein